MTIEKYIGKVILSDAIEFMQQLPEGSVDLILTDPPYGRDYIWLYEALAREGSRVLRVGGSLVAMAPLFCLDEILTQMSKHMKYRWVIHYDYWEGSHARMVMGIEVCWKPLVWYVNQKLTPNRPITDSIRAWARDKSIHPWQQDEGWAVYLINKLTDPGDVVLDPLVGTGTVALVAQALNRRWLACDHDPVMVARAQKRLEAGHALLTESNDGSGRGGSS